MLNLTESFKVISKLKTAKTSLVKNLSDLSRMPFPYYMKINSSKHKKKIGGVVEYKNLQEAKKNYSKLRKKFKEGILIQEKIIGEEIILGIKEDKVFGKLLLIGLGGENLQKKDVIFRTLPLNKSEIKNSLKKLKGYPKMKNLAIKKLIKLIMKFISIVKKEEIIEADLNPIILTSKGAMIVDARINLKN